MYLQVKERIKKNDAHAGIHQIFRNYLFKKSC